MPFCSKCGTEFDDSVKFCPSCGQPSAAGQAQNSNQPLNEAQLKDDAEENKILALLAYIGILFLVPLLAAKESPFAKYHTNQGIVLFIVGIAGSIVLAIVNAILAFIPILGWILAGLLSFVWGALLLILMIIGIVNAVQCKAKPLPIIGKIVILK